MVLDPVSGHRVLLNATAALIFTAVEAPRTVGDLVAQLAAETGLEAAALTDDVIATVDRLVCLGMLIRQDRGAAGDGASSEAGPSGSESDQAELSGSSVVRDMAAAETAEPEDSAGPDRGLATASTAGITWAYETGLRAAAGATVTVRVGPAALVDEVRTAFEAIPTVASHVNGDGPRHRIDVANATSVADASTHGDGTDGATDRGADDAANRASDGAADRASDQLRDGDEQVQIVVDGTVRVTRSDPRGVLGDVFDQLDGVLADHAPGLRFHAGAVERDGRVVVIGGLSGAGKSSLTAALVRAGWCYLTDEVVVVDPQTWQVAPYPRPFDLDGTSCATLGIGDADFDVGRAKAKVLPARMGEVSEGGRVALVVLLTTEVPSNDHEDLSVPVETMPAPEAVMAMVGLTFGPTFDDADALEQLASLCTTVPVLRMTRRPLDAMVTAVEQGFSAA